MDQEKKLVTIANFPDEMQAHMALASLKNQGIDGFVQDKHFTSMKWWLGLNRSGNVSFYVESADSAYQSIEGVKVLRNDIWHHIAAVVESTINQYHLRL